MRKYCTMWVIDTHPRGFRGFLLRAYRVIIIYPLRTCHWRVFEIVFHTHTTRRHFFLFYLFFVFKRVLCLYIIFYFSQSPVTVTERRKRWMAWQRGYFHEALLYYCVA